MKNRRKCEKIWARNKELVLNWLWEAFYEQNREKTLLEPISALIALLRWRCFKYIYMGSEAGLTVKLMLHRWIPVFPVSPVRTWKRWSLRKAKPLFWWLSKRDGSDLILIEMVLSLVWLRLRLHLIWSNFSPEAPDSCWATRFTFFSSEVQSVSRTRCGLGLTLYHATQYSGIF